MKTLEKKCLLVENEPQYHDLIKDMLKNQKGFNIEFYSKETLKEALAFLKNEEIDIILLDLNLSDSASEATFEEIHEKFSHIPIVIISGESNSSLDVEVVKKGAQDFIFKGDLRQNLLIRTIRYAIERKKSELQKDDLQKQLLISTKMASVGMLVAGIAHEINNPLSIIKGYKDLLLNEYRIKDPELADGLDKIDIAIGRISAIIEGLRLYTGMDVDKIENISVDFQLNEGLRLIKPLYLRDGVRLESDFSCKNLTIYGNKGKFQQVITNLLSNAKYAIGNNRGVIKISTCEKNEFIEIKISDSGSGISKNDITRIFDTFFSTKPPTKGVGLGLSISSSIVKSMGGKINVESNLGAGTTFTLLFPKGEKISITDEKQSDGLKKYEKLIGKIIVVDDEEDIRETLKDHLKSFGFDVSIAEDGKKALNIMKKCEFDCIITDLKMPNMRGDELLTELKKLNKKPKVSIVITGDIVADYDKEKRESIRENADFYLPKPFSKKKLYEILSESFKREK